MAAFVKGDVVVVPFPFSAAQGSKRRPAVILASWQYSSTTDYLLALVSAQPHTDPYTFELSDMDVQGGTLAKRSYLRAAYLFAIDEALIGYRIGKLADEKVTTACEAVVRLLST